MMQIAFFRQIVPGYACALAIIVSGCVVGACHSQGAGGEGDHGPSATASASPKAAAAPARTAAFDGPLESGPAQDVLKAKSPQCLACAQVKCAEELHHCNTIARPEDAAPAANAGSASPPELCRDTLQCVVKAGCFGQGSGAACYCGSVLNMDCVSKNKGDGACKAAIERGMESSDPAAIGRNFFDETKGGGVALKLGQCLYDQRCRACF